MSDVSVRCPACAEPALADDEFCESCGTAIGAQREAERKHVEIDAGPAAGVSDVGHTHRRNEDALFVESTRLGAVAVICDGVSSAAGSQVAAQVAAQAMGDLLTRVLATRSPQAKGNLDGLDGLDGLADAEHEVADALVGAGDAVLELPWTAMRDRDSPSCTVVAALWDGNVVTIGWAGDSRAYWIDADGVRRLTSDHSWAQEQVDAGLMSEAAAGADGRAHVITRWLGAESPATAPAVTSLRPETRGRVLLCSDGLWNHLDSDDELATLIDAGPEQALHLARRLTATALDRGGLDNVTVAVIDVLPDLNPGTR